jgi:hypothetical protein
MLTNFLGVLSILTPPLCALAFIMCSKSNPFVVFALDLMSFNPEATFAKVIFYPVFDVKIWVWVIGQW